MENESKVEIGNLLNAQCGQVRWAELERHFARGMVVRVTPDLDLIDVARQIVADNKALIEKWMNSGHIGNASTDEARRWQAEDTTLWAVVCAPWVLVQERETLSRTPE